MKFYVLVALSLLFQPVLMTASDATKQDFKVSIQQAEAKTNIFALSSFAVECAQIADQHGFTREACVDPPTGTLVRQEPFLDREQTAVGAKSFPRFLSYVEKGNPLAEVEVTDLQTPLQRSSSAFEPPSDAVSQPGCMNPTPFHLLNRIPPHYPEQERQSDVEGSVAIDATIGKDGIPRRLRVVSGATPRLNTASVDAVQQWRWEPSTCNGAAVDVETVVTINYQLE